MRRVWGLLWLLSAAVTIGQTNPVPRISAETFFKGAELSDVTLSPNGKLIAGIAHSSNETLVVTVELDSGNRRSLKAGVVEDLTWLTDDRLLLVGGGLNFGSLVAVNRDGSNVKELQKSAIFESRAFRYDFHYVVPMWCPTELTDCLVVEKLEVNVRRMDLPKPEVWWINFNTGKSQLVEKNPGNVVSWILDQKGVPRAGVVVDKDSVRLLYRRDSSEPWRTVHQSTFLNKDIVPVALADRPDVLYVFATGGRDTHGVYEFDAAKNEMGPCIWQNDSFDLSQVRLDHKGSRVAGIRFQSEKPQSEWLLEPWNTQQHQINKALPGRANVLVKSDRNRERHLYISYSDRTPAEYYLFDSRSNTFGIIGKAASWIPPEQLAEMRPIQYQSRDGLTIHGYLTLPVGSSGKNLPMIVMPHGGPWARDTWTFDPEVQFLANRGYAVLQMNFRGSTGYGLKFLRAGYKQFGLKMQDDITDGVKWAIGEQIADPARIAIFGTSYGGYAALMGLILTPELYKCGISCAGVTDVKTLIKPSYRNRRHKLVQMGERELIGDYREEGEQLDAVSPVNLANKIQVPVLVAHGGRDRVVNPEQGTRMVDALKKAGKKYEFIFEPDEGHGFQVETNKVKLFKKIEAFLEQHL